jgi:hypothetical protein
MGWIGDLAEYLACSFAGFMPEFSFHSSQSAAKDVAWVVATGYSGSIGHIGRQDGTEGRPSPSYWYGILGLRFLTDAPSISDTSKFLLIWFLLGMAFFGYDFSMSEISFVSLAL